MSLATFVRFSTVISNIFNILCTVFQAFLPVLPQTLYTLGHYIPIFSTDFFTQIFRCIIKVTQKTCCIVILTFFRFSRFISRSLVSTLLSLIPVATVVFLPYPLLYFFSSSFYSATLLPPRLHYISIKSRILTHILLSHLPGNIIHTSMHIR